LPCSCTLKAIVGDYNFVRAFYILSGESFSRFKRCSAEHWAFERKEFHSAVKMGLLQTGGIVGRTWFLETLLPSGRKHRAPGYERPRVVFWERYVFDRGSYPKIFGLRTASLLHIPLVLAPCLPTKSIQLYEFGRRMDPFWEAAGLP